MIVEVWVLVLKVVSDGFISVNLEFKFGSENRDIVVIFIKLMFFLMCFF